MRPEDPRNAPELTFLSERVLASELAAPLGAELRGPNIPVVGVGTYGSRLPHSLSYQCGKPLAEETIERVVICTPEAADTVSASTKLLTPDPRAAFMRFLATARADWRRTVASQAEKMGISAGRYEAHSTALIAPDTIIAKGVVIEPFATITHGVIIGVDTLVSLGSIVGAHGPAIHKCLDGKLLSWAQIHFGTVQVGNRCEIGCHTVVLRAMLGRTHIGDNSILGNMVHIGHGADVGERVWMAARVTVCGHASIDREVSIGAGATIRDNITIGAAASIGMGSVVVSGVAPGTNVLGVPARESVTTFHGGHTL